MSLIKRFLILALIALTASCGFHLRGAQPLPFDSIYLGLSAYSEMGATLRRQIAANGATLIKDKASDAQVSLIVLKEDHIKTILSLNTKGQVRDYQLQLAFEFKLVDAAGHEVIPASRLSVQRDLTYNDAQLLAKEQEEAQLYREMQNDVVLQLMRRLSSAHWPLPAAQ
ncbi:LPS assembly lipoprotein LptE [Niveibacterium terrae]|uniref:LPS-assembly lipoprotein LptE n=1 Tax=Niveibacterium terrae TaxID=3373598 RepID=UPI003A8F2716